MKETGKRACFIKWKRRVCLIMITLLLLVGMKDAYYDFGLSTPQFSHAAQASEGDNGIRILSCSLKITCSAKSMTLKGVIDANLEPSEVEIYRAKVKANGKNGNFKKIGSCEDFTSGSDSGSSSEWSFRYKDGTVTTGTAYAYKYKAYYKTEGETSQYEECYSKERQGVAAKTSGQYTCKVVTSTKKKLVVKLTGKSKKNGPLEARYAITSYVAGRSDADLRYKNDGGNEICRSLELIKFSYNGKKWYTSGTFSIKGKQSVYLHYEEKIDRSVAWQANNIKISKYQYVQMLAPYVKYNLQAEALYPQIRFNLSSGKAVVGDFVAWNENGEYAYTWEDDIFTRDYEELSDFDQISGE